MAEEPEMHIFLIILILLLILAAAALTVNAVENNKLFADEASVFKRDI